MNPDSIELERVQVSSILGCCTLPGQGRRLYPFSLSYVPLLGRPRHRQGPDLADTGLRRTLMLAAPSRPARKRWLSSLARKIGSAQLLVQCLMGMPCLAHRGPDIRAAARPRRSVSFAGWHARTKRDDLVVPLPYSRRVFASSWLVAITTGLAALHGQMMCCFLCFLVLFGTVNYWRDPRSGWRRRADFFFANFGTLNAKGRRGSAELPKWTDRDRHSEGFWMQKL
eukprot:g32721.t1